MKFLKALGMSAAMVTSVIVVPACSACLLQTHPVIAASLITIDVTLALAISIYAGMR